MSINKKIALSSLLLVSVSVVTHALSLVKEMLVAYRFGTTWEVDAFYIGTTLPTAFNSIIVATLSAVFIPAFIKTRLKGDSLAYRTAAVITNYLFIVSFVLSILVYVFAPSVIVFMFRGLDAATAATAATMLRMAMVMVITGTVIGLISGILNASEKFFWPSFSQSFVTISTIGCVLVFNRSAGVYVLVFGLVIGMVLQLIVLSGILFRKGYAHTFSLKIPDGFDLKSLLLPAALYFATSIIAESYTIVDRIMASFLQQGSVAALGYANKLVQVPLLIFSLSISTVVFPYFSSQVAENQPLSLKDSLSKVIRMSGYLLFPLTVLLIVLGEPVIRLLFERGMFDGRATGLTSLLFRCYAVQIFFFTVVIVFSRVFFAYQEMAYVLIITVLSIAAKIALNVALVNLVKPAAAGIALATSGTYLVGAILYFAFLRRKMECIRGLFIMRGLLVFAAASALMGGATYAAYRYLHASLENAGWLADTAAIVLSAGAGMLLYALISHGLKIYEFDQIKRLVSEKWQEFFPAFMSRSRADKGAGDSASL
jgi:putative peptidoglycan lipid II flippase